MATLTPVDYDPFAPAPKGLRLTPVEGDPFAQAPKRAAGPQVPFTIMDETGKEVNVNATPETRSAFDASQAAEEAARRKEQAAFDATRTPMTRIRDAATFAASVPVRMATQGQYGAGDVFGLVNENAGRNARQSEADFARANQTGLEYAAAAGEVGAGIPMLSTMGAVPGQVLRTGAAAARQLPGEFNAMLRDTRGSAPVPGSGPLPPPPTGGAPVNPLMRTPTRGETFEAAERVKAGTGAAIDLPEMVVGNKYKQSIAAGLRSIPFAGEPVEMMYEKGLSQLRSAKEAAGGALGEAKGAESTGGAIKQSGLDWTRKNSKDYLKDKYDEVASSVDQSVTRPLSETQRVVDTIRREQAISTVMEASAGCGRMPSRTSGARLLPRRNG